MRACTFCRTRTPKTLHAHFARSDRGISDAATKRVCEGWADFEASGSFEQVYAFDQFMQASCPSNVTNSFTLIGSKLAGFFCECACKVWFEFEAACRSEVLKRKLGSLGVLIFRSLARYAFETGSKIGVAGDTRIRSELSLHGVSAGACSRYMA